jgi:hypothetical protein
MKRLFLVIFVLASVSTFGYGQTINGTPIEDLPCDYLDIIQTQSTHGTIRKSTITFDFGQNVPILKKKEAIALLDANNKPITFESIMGALNFMSENGFELVTAYTVTHAKRDIEYHYLLRKKKQ